MPTAPARRSSPLMLFGIVAGVAAAAALAAWGSFSGDGDFGDYWPVLIIIAIAAVVVWGFVVPWALRERRRFARTGLALSVLALLTVAVFWSGLPPVLAFGGLFLGRSARSAAEAVGEKDNLGVAAEIVGAVALLADLVIYIFDQT